MVSVRQDSRHLEQGSIVCENSVLRLRVIRPGTSLRLVIEARDVQGQWVPMASSPPEGHPDYLDADGLEHSMHFFSFDPLQTDGDTYGIILHGMLGEARLTLTSTLSVSSSWTQHRLEIEDIPQMPCRQLTQSWQLAADFPAAEIDWPAQVLLSPHLVETPAAFQQAGSLFAALVPDVEEGDVSLLGLRSTPSEQASLSFGIMDSGQLLLLPPRKLQLVYALCLDARALPLQGFQQIVRLLGNQESLEFTSGALAAPRQGELPPLHALPDTIDWVPFLYEGSPDAIAAWVHYVLSLAEQGDWQLLDDGLGWLDRLCFHQHVYEISGSAALGSIGSGDAWHTAALWMPILALHAFRLTGILEYAYRAKAALSALPATDQARVLHQLAPLFGDVYLHAVHHLALALGPVDIQHVAFTPWGLSLTCNRPEPHTSLRLVVAGADDPYTLTVNDVSLGVIPAAQLEDGVILP